MARCAAWIVGLRSEQAPTRGAAVAALANMPPSAVTELIPLLADPDPRVRFHIQRALISLGPAAVPALSSAAEGETRGVRYTALATLARMACDSAAPPLYRGAIHPDPDTRHISMLGLFLRNDPGRHDTLAQMLDLSPECWYTAVKFVHRTDRLRALHLILESATGRTDPQATWAVKLLLDFGRNAEWTKRIVSQRDAAPRDRYNALVALHAALPQIGAFMRYDRVQRRDLHAHLLGGRPPRTIGEIVRDLAACADSSVRDGARELVAWSELARPAEGQSRHLLREATAPPEELLRGADAPNGPEPSLWQRLRGRK